MEKQIVHGFNHKQAMKTAHQDEAIVLKLRQMFIQNISNQFIQAKKLWNNKDIPALQSHLHHMLGGAQVCAAESLVECITQLKSALKENTQINPELDESWKKIEKACEAYGKFNP